MSRRIIVGPDSDGDLAGDAARVSRLDKAERGAMGVALAELSRALDAEDWSVAVTVSESALAKWRAGASCARRRNDWRATSRRARPRRLRGAGRRLRRIYA